MKNLMNEFMAFHFLNTPRLSSDISHIPVIQVLIYLPWVFGLLQTPNPRPGLLNFHRPYTLCPKCVNHNMWKCVRLVWESASFFSSYIQSLTGLAKWTKWTLVNQTLNLTSHVVSQFCNSYLNNQLKWTN